MTTFHIQKGHDLKLEGVPEYKIQDGPAIQTISCSPPDFKNLKPKLLVKEGDSVSAGTPLFISKQNPELQFLSPVSGTVKKLIYGERRTLLAVVIVLDGDREIDFGGMSEQQIESLGFDEAVRTLMQRGLFINLRQRPFDKIPDLHHRPKAIFVNGMDTAPNAANPGFLLQDRDADLHLGLKILSRLTEGAVHLCHADDAWSSVLEEAVDVQKHAFEGPHPAGLVSTHIHFIDPINKGEVVWTCNAVQVASMGKALRTGRVDADKVVVLSGTGIKNPTYIKTVQGASLEELLKDRVKEGDYRFINGTALYGTQVASNGYLSFYNNTLQVIPEGRARRLLGWAMPGADSLSISSVSYLSAFMPERAWDLNTNINGGHRTIVWTDVYDQVMPLDIYTNFLVKSILAEDIEESENLGILEVSGEDFALATYLCPSKTDVSDIIEQGLHIIEQEGY